MNAEIINRGRGPEIKGTRITVYDVMDYLRENWSLAGIAIVLGVGSDQVKAAVQYIESHRDEVEARYATMLERDARGNSPEIRAKLAASREKLLALREVIKVREVAGVGDAEHPGGR